MIFRPVFSLALTASIAWSATARAEAADGDRGQLSPAFERALAENYDGLPLVGTKRLKVLQFVSKRARNDADRAHLERLKSVPDDVPAGVSPRFFNEFLKIDAWIEFRPLRRLALAAFFDSRLSTMSRADLDFFAANLNYNMGRAPFAPRQYEKFFESKIERLELTDALAIIGRFASAHIAKNSYRNRLIERFVTTNVDRLTDAEIEQAIDALAETNLLFLPTDPIIEMKQEFTANSRSRVAERIRAAQAAARGR